ncbi:MAG TPA: glycine zipper 2TM domain-containing protein [Burkholderiales bacterium]|jgi:outer membrane lipoprotein SlyB|nr:glycine zipper 2TM domain-containing protein [Burkholderiales bacterium]
MKMFRLLSAGLTALAIVMAGCAEQPSRSYAYDAPNYRQGVVDRIEVIKKGDSNNIAGTIIGGIAGGLIGHQIGGGRGQTAATIAGGVGGAMAGNQVQKRTRGANETFRVTVRYDNGATEVIRQDDIADLRTGDRVRIDGGRIYRS